MNTNNTPTTNEIVKDNNNYLKIKLIPQNYAKHELSKVNDVAFENKIALDSWKIDKLLNN